MPGPHTQPPGWGLVCLVARLADLVVRQALIPLSFQRLVASSAFVFCLKGLVPLILAWARQSLADKSVYRRHFLCQAASSARFTLVTSQTACLQQDAAMSNVSDSAVTFRHKALQHGIPESSLDAWEKEGIATYSQLLFRVASAPNQTDPAKLQALLDSMTPKADAVVSSAVHRLLFEAGTFVVAELRQTLEAPAGEPSRRLSAQERNSRLEALQTKLGAFRIAGQFEPSHQLIDLCSAMVVDQAIRHIPLHRCSCRGQEVSSVKKDETLLRLDNAALRLASKPQPLKVDLSTELRVSQALNRRGLALEMAGVASFQVHEEYARSLLEHLHRQPPPRFDPPGIDALIRADRELWTRVSEQVKSDFTGPGKSGVVDSAIQTWQHSMQVAYFLVPVPKPEKPEKLPLKRTWDQTTSSAFTDKGAKGKGKGKFMSQAWQSGKGGKGKSKQGKDKQQTAVPAALKGFDPNFQGHPICFNHSLPHGCQEQTWETEHGPSCRRGLHICMRCHGSHSLASCDK